MRTLIKEWARVKKIKSVARSLRKKGLQFILFDRAENILTFPTSRLASARIAIRRSDLSDKTDLLENFMAILDQLSEKENFPSGTLNLSRALSQYHFAISKLDDERKELLETSYIKEAIESNLELQGQVFLQKKYETIMGYLNNLKDDIKEASNVIVNTARNLWPGGNPTLMLLLEEGNQQYLVPTGVALDPKIVEIGQHFLGKELGKWKIPCGKITPTFMCRLSFRGK